MFKLHVVQAAYGDCLLLEYGTQETGTHYILIDGGPPDTFRFHLQPVLKNIAESGLPLDLVVLSHVDNDHIIGLLDYFVALRMADPGLPAPAGLWHNSFSLTLDPNGIIEPRLSALIVPERASVMASSGLAVLGIQEGAGLRAHALAQGIPINQGFPGNLITVDSAPPSLNFDNLELKIVGPTQTNLDRLQQEWIDWLDENEDGILNDDPFVMANSDQTAPNLSSIMFLAQADDRTMLFTGDGRSDHLLQGLEQAGLLDVHGKLHVNVLKLPHHGSNRNITKKFLKNVTADTYVASANGRDGNPDLATLIWIVETAEKQGRQVEIIVTNETPSLHKLQEEYPQEEYGYSIRALALGEHEILV